MKRTSLAVLTALAVAGLAHGEILDWGSSTAWSDGIKFGSFNDLSNSGFAISSVTPLTYNFGGGLTATVGASLLNSASKWQAGTLYYGGFAPYAFQAGDVLAVGVSGGETAMASLSIQFSSAVTIDSLTIGDVDSNTGRTDRVGMVVSNAGAPFFGPQLLAQASSNPAGFFTAGGLALPSVLTGISTNEKTFGLTATNAWATVTSSADPVTEVVIVLGQTGTSTNGHGVWFSNLSVTAIPEPSTYAIILGCGTLALVAARRRFVRSS
jgi:hypothetical protein